MDGEKAGAYPSSAIYRFKAVRRAGAIRDAAWHLNLTALPVNRQIQKLEEQIGTPLLERHAGGVILTAARCWPAMSSW